MRRAVAVFTLVAVAHETSAADASRFVRHLYDHTPGALRTPPSDSTTTVVILGVDHSAQLVGRWYHPGFFRAWLNRVHPAAICIERSPDEYARGDFYEFTYEAQYIAVPYARDHHLDVCPIDWLPSRDDERLAFGHLDVVDPPAVRPARNFQSFLVFDSTSLRRTLYVADSEPSRTQSRTFFEGPPAPGRRDFPRRLDLYRTYMQAMRLLGAVASHPGDTVVVVVGSLHKNDIERTLQGTPHVQVVQPSSFALPSPATADSALNEPDLAAILSFNLLGIQSTRGPIDWDWLAPLLDRFRAKTHNSAEARLLQTRFAVLRQGFPARNAAARYETIGRTVAPQEHFTFRPSPDDRRIDSYFDPFGNLAVRQRCLIEAAREWAHAGEWERVAALRDEILRSGTWTPLQQGQLSVYWERYIVRARD